MASTQALKGRIRSVKSTKQITKAMQLVAASKMRRAQESSKASAAYTTAARDVLATLAGTQAVADHPLFVQRTVKARLLIVISSDKGLAGAYNSNVLKLYARAVQEDQVAGVKTYTVTIGRKVSQFASRLAGADVLGAYDDLPDRPSSQAFRAIIQTAREHYERGLVDAVDILYTDFVSSVLQVATTSRVLPAGSGVERTGTPLDILYEPTPEIVLDSVAYRLVGAQLFQAFLDAKASEHSMRMMAMKNATDNASDLVDDLTLAMNKARQAAITQELSEISGGVEALND